MLRLDNIVKDYDVAGGKVHALKGVSLAFRSSEFVSVLGASGCGKTTLLNIIGGLDKYTSGDLVINGRSTRLFKDKDWDVYRNHRVGFVFQSYNLIPHQTVLGNVELALNIAGISKAERKKRAAAALEKVGLGDQLNKRPNQLSGGQCQRVAIARALVNDPEILLADEPTGALDSVTSIQIMDLMKEIAGERLVIMVTHNPELAEKYSTRIIKLQDGMVISDSNPYSAEEEENERAAREVADETSAAEKADSKSAENTEKAKMGFGTAFALSARNLIAKRGRTIMVGIAGSIGIIGVAIVLAFSSGITGYIQSMQNDMLSGYPLYVAESSIDYTALLNMTMNMSQQDDKSWYKDNKIYVNSVTKTITELAGTTTTNDITQEYIDYVNAMPKEYTEAVQFDYGIEFAHNVYTNFDYDEEGATDSEGNPIVSREMSITGIRSVYTSILEKIEAYAAYTSLISSVPALSEIPDNKDYVLSQYDLVAGEYPDQTDEGALILVLNADGEINDLTLAQLGYVSSKEFRNYAYKLAGEDEYYQEGYEDIGSKEYDYSEFVGEDAKTFTYYPNSMIFDKIEDGRYTYHPYSDELDAQDENASLARELKVSCVLKLKDDVLYGSLQNGMYYTKALTDYVRGIELGEDTRSQIVTDAMNAETEDKYVTGVTYSYVYYYDEKDENENVVHDVKGEANSVGLGKSLTSLSSMDSTEVMLKIQEYIMAGDTTGLGEYLMYLMSNATNRAVYLSDLGGAAMPEMITFWIDNFDDKDLVTAYLDVWNETHDEAEQIQYTDTVGVLMTIVNTLIQMITVGLVAFTSVSLVVSTVMIGIITYVSVVERIKEIGVIRAMGGRKRDVKNLFTAETFIIGLLAGLIGIIVTYLLSIVANIIIGTITGVYTIAALPPWQALIMVALSVVLTLISGLLPASKAAKQDPVVALRTE